MENTQFEQYSPLEFIREFFNTFSDIISGIIQACAQVFISLGPLNVMVAAYVFLLLLAVVSELKKYQRKQEADRRAFEAALENRRAEEQKRRVEREERLSQYKQRDAAKKATPRVPADAKINYQAQKFNPHSVNRGR